MGFREAAELSVSAREGRANPDLLVEPAWLARHLEDSALRVVDLRPAEDYALGHIPCAVSAPLALFRTEVDGVPGMAIPAGDLERILGGIGISNGTTVVACDGSGGLDAARFLWTLEYYGHRDVRILNGGVTLWQQQGMKLVLAAPAVEAASYRAERDPSRLATLEDVRAALERPDVVLLDVRTPEEYAGLVDQAARNGHIPGAVNLDWVHDLEPDGSGRFQPAAELRRLYESAGVTPDREAIPYCRTGHRAAHTYFVLRLLGYPRVRLYDGSWVEWGNRADTPVE